jgi:DNA-binding IclR family transcriptional regulator
VSGTPSTSASVQSVDRALDVMEALTGAADLGLVEISRRTGLGHSTAHRILMTLSRRGYVCQDPITGRYMLGYAVLRLAEHVAVRDAQLRAVARPHMERVRRVSRETTNLVVLDGSSIVYVDQIPGANSMRMFAEIGGRVAAHATGAGKAILAFTPPEMVTALLAGTLERFTDRTIVEPDRLSAELSEIRRQGFALDREEHEESVSCVAAPIFTHTGAVAGALSVSGPTGRLGELADYAELGELIGRNALEISRELGYGGPARFEAAAA